MIPFSDEEYRDRLLLYGTVITLTRWIEDKVEVLIVDLEEISFKELQDETKKL